MGKLYLISGNDEFAIKAKAREVICEICGEEPENNPDLEIIQGDSDELKPEDILTALLGALNTPSFLSAEKIIWLKHFQHFPKVLDNSKQAKGKVDLIGQITDFIKDGMPEDITLVVDGPEIDQRKAFFKACKAVGEIFFFRKADITSKDFAQSQYDRISDICDKARKKIDQRAIQYLVETVGSDSGRLQMELDKLVCFVGDNPQIGLADCKAIASRTPEALSWDFANALVERKVSAALETISTLMEQMRAEGGSGNLELAILRHAVRTFQEMVQVKNGMKLLNMKRPGKSFFYSLPPELKEQQPDNILLKLHPFRAYKLCESAMGFTDRELALALDALIDANRSLVSGGGDSRITLEQLVLKIVGSPELSK